MKGSGFTGRWSTLRGTYRIPRPLVPHLRSFASSFLGPDADPPHARVSQRTLGISPPCDLRWIQCRSRSFDAAHRAFADAASDFLQRLPAGSSYSDVVFLVSSDPVGEAVAKLLMRFTSRSFACETTISPNWTDSRKRKLRLFQGSGKPKLVTIQTYKGWETTALFVVFVPPALPHSPDARLLYAAMSRLLDNSFGSSLTVFSLCDEFRSFGQEWPSYAEV